MSKVLIREHSAILSTFIKLLFVFETFDLSIFEWPFYTDEQIHEILELISYAQAPGLF